MFRIILTITDSDKLKRHICHSPEEHFLKLIIVDRFCPCQDDGGGENGIWAQRSKRFAWIRVTVLSNERRHREAMDSFVRQNVAKNTDGLYLTVKGFVNSVTGIRLTTWPRVRRLKHLKRLNGYLSNYVLVSEGNYSILNTYYTFTTYYKLRIK